MFKYILLHCIDKYLYIRYKYEIKHVKVFFNSGFDNIHLSKQQRLVLIDITFVGLRPPILVEVGLKYLYPTVDIPSMGGHIAYMNSM